MPLRPTPATPSRSTRTQADRSLGGEEPELQGPSAEQLLRSDTSKLLACNDGRHAWFTCRKQLSFAQIFYTEQQLYYRRLERRVAGAGRDAIKNFHRGQRAALAFSRASLAPVGVCRSKLVSLTCVLCVLGWGAILSVNASV